MSDILRGISRFMNLNASVVKFCKLFFYKLLQICVFVTDFIIIMTLFKADQLHTYSKTKNIYLPYLLTANSSISMFVVMNSKLQDF